MDVEEETNDVKEENVQKVKAPAPKIKAISEENHPKSGVPDHGHCRHVTWQW